MKTLSPTFLIGSIRIGSVQEASCVNFGNSFPMDFTSQKKQNQGFGSISGDHNDIHDILANLNEKDVTELFMEDQQKEEPEWLEKLLHSQNVDINETNDVDEEESW